DRICSTPPSRPGGEGHGGRKLMAELRPEEDFAHVGPGTLVNRYLKTFWQPIHIAAELQQGRPKRVKFAGEQYTLYRGSSGEPHLVQDLCPHRGTALAYGWVEGDDIRCRYHGWKFAPDGKAVELPAEDANFCTKVSIRAFPTREYLGLVFA